MIRGNFEYIYTNISNSIHEIRGCGILNRESAQNFLVKLEVNTYGITYFLVGQVFLILKA